MATSSNESHRDMTAVDQQARAQNQADPNASAWDQMLADYRANFLNQYKPNNAYAFGSIGQSYAGIKGYQGWKQARKDQAYRQQMEAERVARLRANAPTSALTQLDPESRTSQEAQRRLAAGRPMSEEEVQAWQQAENADKQRTQLSKGVEDFFADPSRAGWQADVVQRRLMSDLAGIKEGFNTNLKSAAQSSASQGLLGGSVDVERRGAVERQRDAEAVQAGQTADAAKGDFQMQDQQLRQQLLGLVNSGDVNSGQQLSQSIQGIADATRADAEDYATGQQRQQIRQAGQQWRSQAVGQGLSGAAGLIRQDPYRASSLQAWAGRPVTSGGW